MTVDRESFVAQLPRSAKKVLAAIEFAGGGEAVTMSYDEIAHRFRVGRASVRYALKILELVGLVSITQGPYRVSRFTLSDAWQDLTPDQVARKIPQARLPRPRTGRKRKPLAATEPRKTVLPAPQTVEDDPEPAPQYKVPGLARLRFMGEI